MGSADVHVTDLHLHVGREHDGETWWAVGAEGSYGGDCDRNVVVQIALDASASISGGKRRVVVHLGDGHVAFVITATRQRASSQLFQDSTP